MSRKSNNSFTRLNYEGHLIDELRSELNTIALSDEALGIKEGEIIRGVSWGIKVSRWRFLEPNLNFIEVGSSYHGGFIARAIVDDGTYFAPIAWRPLFGSFERYLRLAKVSQKPPEPIRLDNGIGSFFCVNTGDLVEFVARVTFEMGGVSFMIPIASLKLIQHEIEEEEVESCGD